MCMRASELVAVPARPPRRAPPSPSPPSTLSPLPPPCAAIEGRNNQLELHSRNSAKLMGALEGLVGQLELKGGTEETLRGRELAPARQEGALPLLPPRPSRLRKQLTPSPLPLPPPLPCPATHTASPRSWKLHGSCSTTSWR